jgi:hypothetical protein
MRHIICLLLCFGLYLDSKAQIIQDLEDSGQFEYELTDIGLTPYEDIDDYGSNYDVYPCLYLDNPSYVIRSNGKLSNFESSLLSKIDSELFRLRLEPRHCFVSKKGPETTITYSMGDRHQRTYFIQQGFKSPVMATEMINGNIRVIYDLRPKTK